MTGLWQRLRAWHDRHRASRRERDDERTGLRRLWPRGLTSRVALVLMVCLFVVQALSIAVYVGDRARATTKIFAHSAAERITAIVELMERTPPPRRRALLPAINSPTLWVELAPGRPKTAPGWRPAPEVERRVRDHLHDLGPRPLEVRVFGGWRRDWRGHHRHDGDRAHDRKHDHGPVAMPDLLPSRQKLAIHVGQSDGSWLAFTVSAEATSLRWALQMAFWILLSGGFILLFAIWAARRVAKPLTRFAAAADRLGVDVNAPPLPETGAAELRKASRAFNRMQDRLRRFVEDRTLMLAAISHDLRTGLTRLKLRSEFIADAEQQKKALADLDEMEAMLDATLAFARDDAAKEPRRRFDLAALLQSLADEQTDQGAQAAYDGPDHLPFEGRPTALKRAFANLVGNAVKYGGAAEIALTETGKGLRITVADRGPGIPEEARERVFAPFFRLETSRSRETGGSGLGLAVARSIVRRHGGDIALALRPGGGLVVTVSLPRVGL